MQELFSAENSKIRLLSSSNSCGQTPGEGQHMDDISTALALEVKKEIADRYFGFRKIIEDDTNNYLEKISTTALELENSVGFDLIRLYSLLSESIFITQFTQIAQFTGDYFFDSYINSSPTIRKRLFHSKKIRGFTRWRRYRNLFHDTYQDLYDHINAYRRLLTELTEEHTVISEEIAIFYKKNDINTIMQFFRNMDSMGESSLKNTSQDNGLMKSHDLREKLKITAPVPARKQLPEISAIPPLNAIKASLNRLLRRSFFVQPGDFDPKLF